MKSQQKEADLTSMTCKGCVFAEFATLKDNTNSEGFEEYTQFGCLAGRIAKFSETDEIIRLYEEDISYFGLKRFCNLYRGDEWLKKNPENPLDKAIDESKPTFSIVIFNKKNPKCELEEVVNSILNIDYDLDKINIVISSDYGVLPPSVLVGISDTIHKKGIKNNIVINVPNVDSRIRDFNAFSKCVGYSYILKMNNDCVIPRDMLKNIDISLNNDMEKNILFRHRSISCISFPIVNNEYLKHNDFDLMINSIENTAKKMNMIKLL